MNIEQLIKEESRVSHLKQYEPGMVKYVCAFPDYYQYGLPNIGMQVIYRECNVHEGVVPDRYYIPEENFECKDITWERKFKVNECDILGFTISYEGTYTNILKSLELCGIPFRQKDRGDNYPILLAGGPTVMYNPMPLAKFFDVFVLGEGEEVIHKILEAYKSKKNEGKSEILKELAKIKGLYVPSLHKDKKVKQVPPISIDKYPAHSEFMTNNCVYGEKTFTIEVRRGCNQKCRFCYMGTRLRPARTISKDVFMKLVDIGLEQSKIIKCFYEGLETEIVEEYLSYIIDKGGQVRIGSQRLEKLSKKIVEIIAECNQRKLVIAPESSERLRKVIGKESIKNKDIISMIETAMENGILDIGLYFIIGIPQEENADIEEIAKLILQVREKMNQYGNKHGQLEIGINPLFPKPWTSFQFAKANLPEEINDKFKYLIEKLEGKYPLVISNDVVDEKVERREIALEVISSIKIETTIGSSIVFSQPILSRGGDELCDVIEYIYKYGDALENWSKALELYNIKYESYFKQYDFNENLPWDIQKCYVSKEHLIKEYKLGQKFLPTIPCNTKCQSCAEKCI